MKYAHYILTICNTGETVKFMIDDGHNGNCITINCDYFEHIYGYYELYDTHSILIASLPDYIFRKVKEVYI